MSAGKVLARLTLLPPLLVMAWLLAGLPLLLAGHFTPGLMLATWIPIALVLVTLGLRWVPDRWPDGPPAAADNGDRRPGTLWWAVCGVVAVAAGFAVQQIIMHSEQVIVRRDPAGYVQFAYWIAHHGSLPISQTRQAFGPATPTLTFDSLAFFQRGHTVVPQFMAGLPMTLAAGFWIGGVKLVVLMAPLLGAGAVLTFGGLVARLAGPRWAPLGALVLALTLPEQYTSRSTYSEPLAQILLFGALCLLIDALRVHRRTAAAQTESGGPSAAAVPDEAPHTAFVMSATQETYAESTPGEPNAASVELALKTLESIAAEAREAAAAPISTFAPEAPFRVVDQDTPAGDAQSEASDSGAAAPPWSVLAEPAESLATGTASSMRDAADAPTAPDIPVVPEDAGPPEALAETGAPQAHASTVVVEVHAGSKVPARVMAALAGLAFGLIILVRIDGIGDILPLIPYCGLLLLARRPQAVPLAAGALVGAVFGFVDGYVLSRPYLVSLSSSLRPLGLLAAGFVVLTVAGYALLRWRGVPRFAGPRLSWIPNATGLIAVLVMIGFAVRPYVQTVRGETSPVTVAFVAEVQKLAHLSIDPTRTYAEDSFYWVIWYIGVPTVLLATFGAMLLIRGVLTRQAPHGAARMAVPGADVPQTRAAVVEPDTVRAEAEPEAGAGAAESNSGADAADSRTYAEEADSEAHSGRAEPEAATGGAAEPEAGSEAGVSEAGARAIGAEIGTETVSSEVRSEADPGVVKSAGEAETVESQADTGGAELEAPNGVTEPEAYSEAGGVESRDEVTEPEAYAEAGGVESRDEVTEPEAYSKAGGVESRDEVTEPEAHSETAGAQSRNRAGEPESQPESAGREARIRTAVPTARGTNAALIWALPVMVIGWTVVTTLWRPAITPDQPWASRRLVPVVLPGLIVLAVWACAWLVHRARERGSGRVAGGVIAGCCAIALLLPTSVTTFGVGTTKGGPLGIRPTAHGLAFKRTDGGEIQMVRDVCNGIGHGGSVVIVDSLTADRFTQVVRGMCNIPAARMTSPTPDAVGQVVQSILQAGRRPLLLAADSAELAPYGGTIRPIATLTTRQDEHRLTSPPDTTWRLVINVWMSEPDLPPT